APNAKAMTATSMLVRMASSCPSIGRTTQNKSSAGGFTAPTMADQWLGGVWSMTVAGLHRFPSRVRSIAVHTIALLVLPFLNRPLKRPHHALHGPHMSALPAGETDEAATAQARTLVGLSVRKTN